MTTKFPKEPRLLDRAYLDWLRGQKCVFSGLPSSGTEAVDPAHIGGGGTGYKTHDYETAPMTEDYYINGPIQADLWISSTHEDAVISVRIDEVTQSGRVAPITNGLLLASARQVNVSRSRFLDGEMIQPYHYFTQEAETFLVPGEITKVQVEIFSTSALIREGNRLRVSISPSNQAQGMLNLPRRAMVEGGTTTIHNSSEHPSSVVLPIVPTSELN